MGERKAAALPALPPFETMARAIHGSYLSRWLLRDPDGPQRAVTIAPPERRRKRPVSAA